MGDALEELGWSKQSLRLPRRGDEGGGAGEFVTHSDGGSSEATAVTGRPLSYSLILASVPRRTRHDEFVSPPCPRG